MKWMNTTTLESCDQSITPQPIHLNSVQLAGALFFLALNAAGSIFGCLHPVTSYWLYLALSLPTCYMGVSCGQSVKQSVLCWSTSTVKFSKPSKIFRKDAQHSLNQPCGFKRHISQLTCINSVTSMPCAGLPRQILESRLTRVLGYPIGFCNLPSQH